MGYGQSKRFTSESKVTENASYGSFLLLLFPLIDVPFNFGTDGYFLLSYDVFLGLQVLARRTLLGCTGIRSP